MCAAFAGVGRRAVLGGLAGLAASGQLPAAERDTALAGGTAGLVPGSFEGSASYTMSNGAMELTFLPTGASMASLILRDDPEKLSPLWNSVRLNREHGRDASPTSVTGHLLGLDGFGTPSPEEAKVGLVQHGEAHLTTFKVQSHKAGTLTETTLTGTMPVVQETLTRTMRMVDGEHVVYVENRLDSLLGFDRPVSWVEHATVGPPFMEPGVSVLDVSVAKARTQAYAAGGASVQRRLASDKDFTWPLAPTVDGGQADLRQTPGTLPAIEFAITLLDTSRDLVWATVLNPRRGLVFGYLFRRADYPWMLHWGSYGLPGQPVRGLEFGMSPMRRRFAVDTGKMFDTPTFRWLPARSSLSTAFLLFYASVPGGFSRVDEVRLEQGHILIDDHATGQQVRLPASRSL